MTARAILPAAALAIAGGLALPAAAAPAVDQMVVFRSGEAKIRTAGTGATRVRAGRKRCRVPRRTALSALVRSRVARLRVRDFSGSCDPASLFVRAIGPDGNRGQSGWVYKVGNRLATAGAADPGGPFGRGRLRAGARVTWFYCTLRRGGCQRTLRTRARHEGGGRVTVRVVAHDDEGRGRRASAARVRAGGVTAWTDSDGLAVLSLPPGRHRVVADKRGAVRSFAEVVRVE